MKPIYKQQMARKRKQERHKLKYGTYILRSFLLLGILTISFTNKTAYGAVIFDNSGGTGTVMNEENSGTLDTYLTGTVGSQATSSLPILFHLPMSGFIRIKSVDNLDTDLMNIRISTTYANSGYNMLNHAGIGLQTGTYIGNGVWEYVFSDCPSTCGSSDTAIDMDQGWFTALKINHTDGVNGDLRIDGGTGSLGVSRSTNPGTTYTGSFAYIICDSGGCDDPTGNDFGTGLETQFFTISVSTTTNTFGVTGYINADDLTGLVLDFNVSTPLFSQWNYESFNATTSGVFSMSIPYQNFSTSTLQFFTFRSRMFYESTNPFSSTTPITIIDQISTTTNVLGYTSNVLTPDEVLEGSVTSCNLLNPFTFNMGDCVSFLLWPSPTQVDQNILDLKEHFLNIWPLGYVTRFVDILSSEDTTALPSISYTTASSSMFGVIDIEFDPFGSLDDVDSPMLYTSDTSGDAQTIWEIMEYPIFVVVYLMLIFMIIHDVTGISKHASHKKR